MPCALDLFAQPAENRKNKKLGPISEKLLTRIRLRTSEKNISKFNELLTRPRIIETNIKNLTNSLSIWGVEFGKDRYPLRSSQNI